MAEDEPYKPRYKGFDEEATKRAQDTAERSREVQAGPGEYADAEYMEGGPVEAERRRAEMGRGRSGTPGVEASKEDVDTATEAARKRGESA